MKKELKIFITTIVLTHLCMSVHKQTYFSETAEKVIVRIERFMNQDSFPEENEREYADTQMVFPISSVCNSFFYSKWNNGPAGEIHSDWSKFIGHPNKTFISIHSDGCIGRSVVIWLHHLII